MAHVLARHVVEADLGDEDRLERDGRRSLPDQRFLPAGARPVKPVPPTSGSSSRPILTPSEGTRARPT